MCCRAVAERGLQFIRSAGVALAATFKILTLPVFPGDTPTAFKDNRTPYKWSGNRLWSQRISGYALCNLQEEHFAAATAS